jgi:hypothetical protein
MVNADLRSAEVIKRTIGIDMPSVAEIGVYNGDMSSRLIIHPNLVLTMIDPWGEFIADSYIESEDDKAFISKEKWDEVKEQALSRVMFAKDRVRVYQGTSDGAAEHFKDELFDVVFIDGDHSYKQTSKDISSWWCLVAPGGYLGGHDYRSDKKFGVIQAVDEFASEHGLHIEHGENMTWFVRK